MKKIIFLSFIIFYSFANFIFAQQKYEAEEAFFAIQELVVTSASKKEQKVSDAPSFVSIITSSIIKNYGYKTISEALRHITGIYNNNDRYFESVGIRGVNLPGDFNTRLMILFDGHTMNEQWGGTSNVDEIFGLNLDLVERIEVVKGPGSSLYGSNAFFCIINIVTKKVNKIDYIKTSGEITTEIDRKKILVSGGKKISDNFNFIFSASSMEQDGLDYYFPEFDDINLSLDQLNDTDKPTARYENDTQYYNSRGVSKGNDKEKTTSVFTNLQYKNSNFIVKYSDRKKIIPQSYFGGIFNSKNNYVKEKRYFLEARTTKKIRENDSLKLRAYYDYYRYLDSIEYNSWYLTAGYPFFYDLGENNFYGSEIQYENNFFENDNMIIGFEFQKHKTEQASWEHTFKGYSGDVDLADGSGTTTVQYPLDKRDFNIWNLYLQNYYYPTKNLDLLLGLRYTKNSLYKGELSPRAGIIYRATEKLTSKLLYSTGFRAPTIYERFFDDLTSLIGNDKLGPETIKNYEFIVEYMLPFNIRKVISLYYSEVKDIIKQEVINYPNYNYAGDNTAAQFQNTSKIKIKGIELSLERNTFEKLNGFFNVCYNKTEDKITNTELVNSPEWIGSFGLDYKLSKIFTIAMENNYVGKRKDTNGTELKSYLISDIIFTANNLIDKFDLTFKINNVFDKEERHVLSDDYSPITSISQPGRNLYLKIDYKF